MINNIFQIVVVVFVFMGCESLSSTPSTDSEIARIDTDIYYSGLFRVDNSVYFNSQDSIELNTTGWSQYSSCLNYQINQYEQTDSTQSNSFLFFGLKASGVLKSSCSFETNKDSVLILDNSKFSSSHVLHLLGYSQDTNGIFNPYISDSLILRNGNRVWDTVVVGLDTAGASFKLNLDTSRGEFVSRTYLSDSIYSFKKVSVKTCDVEYEHCDAPVGVDTLWSVTTSIDSLKSDTLEWLFSSYCDDGKPVCRSQAGVEVISLSEADSLFEFRTFYTELGLVRNDCTRDEHRIVKSSLKSNESSSLGVWGNSFSIEFDYFDMEVGEEECLGEQVVDTLNLGLETL